MNDRQAITYPAVLYMYAGISSGVIAVLLGLSVGSLVKAEDPPISYQQQIRPLFQAKCYSCHQPARDLGDYTMVQFETLFGAGESGDPARFVFTLRVALEVRSRVPVLDASRSALPAGCRAPAPPATGAFGATGPL